MQTDYFYSQLIENKHVVSKLRRLRKPGAPLPSPPLRAEDEIRRHITGTECRLAHYYKSCKAVAALVFLFPMFRLCITRDAFHMSCSAATQLVAFERHYCEKRDSLCLHIEVSLCESDSGSIFLDAALLYPGTPDGMVLNPLDFSSISIW